MECRVAKKGCYGKLVSGQLYYKVRAPDGSEVIVCHACLRAGTPFESLLSSGVQGNEEEDKPRKRKRKPTKNVVDEKEQTRKRSLQQMIEEGNEPSVDENGKRIKG